MSDENITGKVLGDYGIKDETQKRQTPRNDYGRQGGLFGDGGVPESRFKARGVKVNYGRTTQPVVARPDPVPISQSGDLPSWLKMSMTSIRTALGMLAKRNGYAELPPDKAESIATHVTYAFSDLLDRAGIVWRTEGYREFRDFMRGWLPKQMLVVPGQAPLALWEHGTAVEKNFTGPAEEEAMLRVASTFGVDEERALAILAGLEKEGVRLTADVEKGE